MSRISHHSSSLLQPNLKQMSSLLQFKLPPEQHSPVYHDAIELPQFLAHNLKANNRRVKQLCGQNAILTAFYYSLLRLAFDLEDGKDVAERARRILTGDQQFGDGELEDRTLSDKQYRSFLTEFMDILQREGPLQEAVKPFPIIDTILLRMFQRMVPVTLLLRDDEDPKVAGRVLSFLANKFGMRLQAISGCFKLVEADTFIYVQDMTEVYLVYVEQLEGIREESENESQPISSNNSFRRGSINTQKSNKNIAQNSEKANNFQTVINILQSHNSTGSKSNTDEGASLSSNLTSRGNIGKIKENISQQQMAKSECSKLSIPSNNFSDNSATSTPIQTSPRVSESSKMVKTYGGIPPPKQQYSKFSSQIYTQGKPSNLAIFSSFSPAAQPPSKNSIQQSQESVCDDSGYMKFTQGGVLELLDEKFRQEIKMIKKKYRAERGNVKPFL